MARYGTASSLPVYLILTSCGPLLLPIALGAHDYGEVLRISHLFYEAERSGRLPSENRVPWRGDAFLSDGQDHGNDLSGGYHDGETCSSSDCPKINQLIYIRTMGGQHNLLKLSPVWYQREFYSSAEET
jgi:hypothetical protein